MADVVIIGSDGLDPRWLKYYAKQGVCTNIVEHSDKVKLADISSYKVDSHSQPYTPTAWSCVYTGATPKVHGVSMPGENMVDFDFREELGSTLFDDFSNEGLKVGSFRMPMTWPARPVNGWMVSGFPSGWRGDTEIDDLVVYGKDTSEIESLHRIEEGRIEEQENSSVVSYARTERRSIDTFFDLTEGDEDVLFYGTQNPDKLGHVWERKDEAEDFLTSAECKVGCELTDQLIGRIIEEIDPEYLFLVSDHGFSRHVDKQDWHSMHSTAIEYRKDGNETVGDVDSIIDVRQHILDSLGVDRAVEPFEIEASDDEITEEQREDIEDRLEDLGYL